MIVVSTIGHIGRPARPHDRGAVYEGIEESEVVTRYVLAMDAALRRLGHTSIPLMGGSYADHWGIADSAGAHVYLQCHVNAGRGDYGLLVHDHRSTRGRALATVVAERMSTATSWRWRVAAGRPDTDGQPRDEDFTEAYSTISGVRAVALCVEPYFLDGPQRASMLDSLDDLGLALAMAVDYWHRMERK